MGFLPPRTRRTALESRRRATGRSRPQLIDSAGPLQSSRGPRLRSATGLSASQRKSRCTALPTHSKLDGSWHRRLKAKRQALRACRSLLPVLPVGFRLKPTLVDLTGQLSNPSVALQRMLDGKKSQVRRTSTVSAASPAKQQQVRLSDSQQAELVRRHHEGRSRRSWRGPTGSTWRRFGHPSGDHLRRDNTDLRSRHLPASQGRSSLGSKLARNS